MWQLYNEDTFEWMNKQEEFSIHSVITDPPYAIEEFNNNNLEKMKNGNGGIWRIPPSIGGHKRSPLPRFTVFSNEHYDVMYEYFNRWGKAVNRLLVPGGHIFIATTPIFYHEVSRALVDAGFESRGMIIRLVQTLRGGFRPKNAEKEFEYISTMPRACFEPWGLFRKPIEKDLTVAENLRKWKAGALRRNPDGNPFTDVIKSERTPEKERRIAKHPTLKPQSFMRRLVWASLPCKEGVILDTFCGAGSTLAASEAFGYNSIGIDINKEYIDLAYNAIPRLSSIKLNPWDLNDEECKNVKNIKPYTVTSLSEVWD